MKAGWQYKTLNHIAENLDGKRVPITKNVRSSGAYPYYGASGIVDFVGDYIFDGDLLLVSEDGANLLARTYPIAFSISGKAWVNNHAHVLRFKENVTQKLVEYYLNSIPLNDYVSGMAQPKLNQKMLNTIPVPFPPLSEQQRIVTILDEAFEGIATATANAKKNLAHARELFNAYVQKFFFDKNNGWEEKKLSDVVAELITGPFGSSLHKSDYVASGIPVVNPQNIIGGEIVPFDKTMVSEETRARLTKFSLREKDIIIARRGEMGRCAVVDKVKSGWLCGTGSMIIRLKNTASEQYIMQLLQSTTVRKRLEGDAIGATMSNLNQDILLGVRFHLPSVEEQHNIIKKLDELSTETKKLEAIYQQKLTALQELKKSILNQAFSGQLN